MSGPDHKGPCTSHRLYHLTCDELAVLTAAYAGRCGSCTISGTETGHGFLHIDHDPRRGLWAVRGLLCSRCNSRIGPGVAKAPGDEAYLADPWYLRRLAERGLSVEPIPEPRIGSIVAGRRHKWQRTERGWEAMAQHFRWGALTWSGINHVLGPYNIRVIVQE